MTDPGTLWSHNGDLYAYHALSGHNVAQGICVNTTTGAMADVPLPMVDTWNDTHTLVAGLAQQVTALGSAMQALASGGTSLDTAAVLAAVKAVGDQESTAVASLKQQVADLQARLAAALAAAGQALGN